MTGMDHEALVEIAAPAATVWQVLTDVEREPEWSPTMTRVERLDRGGPFAVGSSARIKQPRLPVAVWRVTALDEGRSFVWEARSGGVTTIAGHDIDEGDAVVRVRLSIRQTGPAARLAGLLWGGLVRRYVAAEAAGLKARCEGLAAGAA